MTVTLHHGDCKDVLRDIPTNSVDLILTDPPYYKVKGDYWDRQWDTAQGFLDWLDEITEQYSRILKPNGSLYLFASPQMSARVEVLTSKRFNVLNNIRWVKEAGWHNKTEKEALRSYLSPHESIIFAEPYGTNGAELFGYGYASGKLHSEVMKPIKDYLNSERERAGITVKQIDKATGTAMAFHWFSHPSQWSLPTKEWYERLRVVFSELNHGGMYLQREYEDLRTQYEDLRTQYEDLRTQYEDLRRPFSVSADVPYTDVWTFKTVKPYKGKHPCEKPLDMLEHIIKTSSKPGAVVLDSFMGTGNTGKAAVSLGRDFIGIEKDVRYFARANEQIAARQLELMP